MVAIDKEARAALKRKEKAKVALFLCTQIERSEIFRELGICNCANITVVDFRGVTGKAFP